MPSLTIQAVAPVLALAVCGLVTKVSRLTAPVVERLRRHREQRIRVRAYFRWQQSGCPVGRDLDFWVQASQSEPRWLWPARLTDHHHRGLRKLSPDLIDKASTETAAQVVRIGLTFLATTAFCLLSLLSPDSLLLGGSERINVPLTGPISFFGFMLLGPAVLIMLRIYLQIYVEHSDRLNYLALRRPINRAPTLVPLKNPLIRVLGGLSFYIILPMAMLSFAWKAAVFPNWGSGLLCVAIGVIAGHAMLPLHQISWRSRMLMSLSAALLAGGVFAGRVMVGFEPFRRPFNLVHATLSGQMFPGEDLRYANLDYANLSGTYLFGADLRHAELFGTNLSGADLSGAKLTGAALRDAKLTGANLTNARLPNAYLSDADLTGANLTNAQLFGADLTGANLTSANLSHDDLRDVDLGDANLTGANLTDADLSGAISLIEAQLISACGSAHTKLPGDFTIKLKPCPGNQ
jgi:uncharacterized protein YjbI with pentapeptide repeats